MRNGGGSHANQVLDIRGGEVPKVNAKNSLNKMEKLSFAMQKGWIESCHDLSEGGLSVTLSEMCMAGNLGADIDLSGFNLPARTALYSESASRWVIAVSGKNVKNVEKTFAGMALHPIGKVSHSKDLKIRSGKKQILKIKLDEIVKWFHHFSDQQ